MGIGKQIGRRNAPTVLNSAYYSTLFLDGRAASLEQQAGGPIANPIEMGSSHELSIKKFEKIPEYKKEFEAVFGPGRLTIEKIEMVIASFERTVLSGDSPFDRYLYRDEKSALNAAAVRGLRIFTDKNKGTVRPAIRSGRRIRCSATGSIITWARESTGRASWWIWDGIEQTKVESDQGAFRTPSLRNVALTAPYMHDGSLKTLKEVVDFYEGGGTSNPWLDPEIQGVEVERARRRRTWWRFWNR